MTKLLKEPLLHFLLLGGALFGLFQILNDGKTAEGETTQTSTLPKAISKEILIRTGLIENLAAQFKKVWQRVPTEQEMTGLIDSYVHDEILYRQALELGLDRDDPMVRQRMRQKMEFFTEDIAALAEPSEKALTDYLEAHKEAYRRDSVFTFQQVYLNAKARAQTIDTDIQTTLTELRTAGAGSNISEMGDRTMLEQVFNKATQHDIERLFGKEFLQGLLKVPTGTWEGPVKSGYGVHLVLMSERVEGELPPLDEVRNEVERDWRNAKSEESNKVLYERWRAAYTVTIENPSSEQEGDSK